MGPGGYIKIFVVKKQRSKHRTFQPPYRQKHPLETVSTCPKFFAHEIFTLQDPVQHNKYHMLTKFYTVLSLAPAPIFLAFGFISLSSVPALCGSFPYEMTVMWFVMALAHTPPWIIALQQFYFSRNA